MSILKIIRYLAKIKRQLSPRTSIPYNFNCFAVTTITIIHVIRASCKRSFLFFFSFNIPMIPGSTATLTHYFKPRSCFNFAGEG